MGIYVVTQPTGPHIPGEVVEITEEHEANGVDVQRLLDRNAIRPADPDEEHLARPLGEAQRDVLLEIPVVQPMQGMPAESPEEGKVPDAGEPHTVLRRDPEAPAKTGGRTTSRKKSA